jgi:hypothetical protein
MGEAPGEAAWGKHTGDRSAPEVRTLPFSDRAPCEGIPGAKPLVKKTAGGNRLMT